MGFSFVFAFSSGFKSLLPPSLLIDLSDFGLIGIVGFGKGDHTGDKLERSNCSTNITVSDLAIFCILINQN